MSCLANRLVLAVVLAACVAVPGVHAQPYWGCLGYCNSPLTSMGCYGYCPYNPYPVNNCFSYNCPTNYGGYYNPYGFYDDVGSFMSGYADIISARGKAKVSSEKADLIKQQVERAKIKNRRASFDEWLYERKMTPTVEENRERSLKEELRYIQNNPPVSEIYSGRALNVLLADIQKLNALKVPGPLVVVQAPTLRQINVTVPGSNASAGILKNGGKLSWPPTLLTSGFREDRAVIDELAQKLVKEAAAGKVDADALDSLRQRVADFERKLAFQITDMPPNQYLEGRGFLEDINRALRVFRQANAVNYFNGTYTARGDNVHELVQNMTEAGLRFAAATSGDEAAYMTLYQAMVHYDIDANAMHSTLSTTARPREGKKNDSAKEEKKD